MPLVGIVRGFGEGEVATGYIIKLTKALRKRFGTKIQLEEIAVGNCGEYGCDLKSDEIGRMRKCDCIFAGDMSHNANPIDFTIEDIAMSLDNNIEYTCIQGIDKMAHVNMHIASYFDGGFSLREGIREVHGCTETRVCSTFSAKNIVKSVSDKCGERRRRLSFVKDGDNEYCAKLFYDKFCDYTMPLSNYHLLKFNIRDITYEIINNPGQFDTIFASKTFGEYVKGLCLCEMKEEFTAYRKFAEQINVYSVDAVEDNSPTKDYTPSLSSYIVAFADMLRDEFSMDKEATALNFAIRGVYERKISPYNGEEFISAIIEELQKPLKGVYSKKPANRIYKLK